MKILIKVTKEILERSKMCGIEGLYKLNTGCAIALAVNDLFERASVGSERIGMSYGYGISSKIITIGLPESARQFIRMFDSCKYKTNGPQLRVQMEPISFEIDVPMEVIESIGISQAYKVLSESKTLELVQI